MKSFKIIIKSLLLRQLFFSIIRLQFCGYYFVILLHFLCVAASMMYWLFEDRILWKLWFEFVIFRWVRRIDNIILNENSQRITFYYENCLHLWFWRLFAWVKHSIAHWNRSVHHLQERFTWENANKKMAKQNEQKKALPYTQVWVIRKEAPQNFQRCFNMIWHHVKLCATRKTNQSETEGKMQEKRKWATWNDSMNIFLEKKKIFCVVASLTIFHFITSFSVF